VGAPLAIVDKRRTDMNVAEVMNMNRRAHADLLQLIEDKPALTQQAMNGILVAKNLERIADHASNIATDVIFWIRGADVRHQLSLSVD
jgi:phosphate transport system protein